MTRLFFPREICTYSNFCFITCVCVCFFFNFISYNLSLIFTLHDFCVPIKHGFLRVLTFSADMNCFYLSTFYSILTFLYFYTITNFDSHYHLYFYDCFHYYCCYYYLSHCHYYFFISMLLTVISPVFIILFHNFLYVEYF